MAKSSHILGAVFAIVIASTVLSAQATAPAAPPATEAAGGDVENGKRVYMKETCFFCHGTVGQGAGNTGARLTPPARNLAGFIRYIRRPTGSMAAYTEKVISDQDLTDIYAYLRSIPPPKPTKDIPLLNQLKQR
jgi:ubiquinol-cytochrome c reductase cytochrome c subunit